MIATLQALELACFGADAWSADALAAEADRSFFLLSPDRLGYVIGLPILDECELLRIGVHPSAQGQGRGRHLLDDFHAEAQRRGAVRTLLEVRADNTPAIRLYVGAGYVLEGRRRSYYAQGTVDALLYGRSSGGA